MYMLRLDKFAIICLLFISIGFFLTIPAFYQGMIVSDDVLVHLNWHRCFYDQLIAGEWYPRWLIDMNGGRGSPVFFFYPPLPYYISSFFEYLLPKTYPEWTAIYLSCGLSFGISGITSFLLLKNYTQNFWALILALFYIIAPFHLFVDFYHRFSYSELWAFTWTPLVIHCLINSHNSGIRQYLNLSISYALLLITHIPTILIVTPFILIYSIVNIKKIKSILKVIFSLLYGIMMTSFYVLPMLLYQQYISLDMMWMDKYSIFNNFLMMKSVFNSDYYLGLAIVNLVLFLLLTISINKNIDKNVFFWLISGIVSIVLMFEMSSFAWSVIPLIHKIQFPWRLNLITLISTIVSSSIILRHDGIEYSKKNYLVKNMIICLLFAQVVSVCMQILPLKKASLSHEEMARASHELNVKLGAFEYTPRWASDMILSKIKYRELDKSESKFHIFGEGELLVLKWSPRKIELQTSSNKGFTATITQFYFPYWQVIADQDEKKMENSPNKDGLIELFIPSGRHLITIRLVQGIPEIAGKAMSIFALFLIYISIIYNKYSHNSIHNKLEHAGK